EYGRNCADKLCTRLVKDRIALISGLAVGVDSIVHRCAVNNGGYTVGVLGCGIMVNYPAENEELKERIISSGGAVISELLPYTSVSAGYFKYRNRIISGLGCGVLVPEASSKSGALLTAEHASKQGRTVFCVPPHDIFAERFCGVFSLIRGGAVSVFDVTDIYSRLAAIMQSDSVRESARLMRLCRGTAKHAPQPVVKAAEVRETAADTAQQQPDTAPEKVQPDLSSLGPEEAEVVKLVAEKPMTMDELIDKTGLSHDKMCAITLGLELSDVITRNQTGTFSVAQA
ncbi:MAG: DNA-processing protein DprA, partial [Oscillospiraceae bacterium]